MKKILVFIIFLLLAFGFSRKETFAYSNTCDWPLLDKPSSAYDGYPSFCVGNFNSPQDLRSHRVKFECLDNCGGNLAYIIQSVFGTPQSYSLSGVQDSDMQNINGKYFTCLTGDFDSSIVDAVNYRLNLVSPFCTVSSLGVFLAAPGGAILKVVAGSNFSSLCQNVLGEFKPGISGTLYDSSGNTGCYDYTVLQVSNGTVQLAGSPTPYPTVPPPPLFCDSSNNPTGTLTNRLYTAIGCIPYWSTAQITGFLLKWALGIGGGIAFLMIVYAGFMIMTSRGDPGRLKAGQELLTAAIAATIMMIFSVIILRLIGVDLLGVLKQGSSP
ncbi:hypothetical protein A2627_00655 [Candidatus Woesebacteria bacterium RIFCSPHIGHO2_01_FULL_39_28]|uniref:Uncharacterized protein n=1 Tax=Candidatus Woesebacteria bacterium RIFCSPHIGHO2_01_FULL_39_28 TaxID=1802496 RepID=A0A1F7YN62_9BACT|nr:MAG: hypothetical protein A2627_00655 [Candidatus Woesebacteria bacterium RIFCSPHIGHO2_01_FULL_39_28]OGM56678.1 MAG: hypothetical protein A3A50_04965 [Candidatus Woesebacteria bacterium RIFCSPLOWO2_01_FULL_38_20]